MIMRKEGRKKNEKNKKRWSKDRQTKNTKQTQKIAGNTIKVSVLE